MDYEVQNGFSPGVFASSSQMSSVLTGRESGSFGGDGGQSSSASSSSSSTFMGISGGGSGNFGRRNEQGGENPNLISVESTAEWQVNDISFDGQERYLQPLIFSDHVAKLAHKINWRELIGDTTTRDEPGEEEEGSNEAQKLDVSSDKQGKNEASNRKQDGLHTVGPWDGIAKKLHQALSEMNVLLDVVKVAQGKQYLSIDPVFQHQHDLQQQQQQEQIKEADYRALTITGKRMALTRASGVLKEFEERMLNKTPSGVAKQMESDNYLEELREMRERWRLKKVGNTILGDLGYRSYGTKFRPNATFEVKRNAETSSDVVEGSCLEVTVPKDLEKPLSLVITIEKDGCREEDVFSNSGLNVDRCLGSQREHQTFPWQSKLQNAQQTLLVRDIFMQLSREAVEMENRVVVVKENCLTVSLGSSYLLKIRMVPSQNFNLFRGSFGSTSERMRVECLEGNLRRMFCEDLASEEATFFRPLSMPLLPENKVGRLDGPNATTSRTTQEDVVRRKLFLERVVEEASHFLLVKRVQAVLRHFCKECVEPQLTWHWSQTSPTWTVIRAQIVTTHYEACGKGYFFLEIGADSIDLVTKDGDRTQLSSTPQELTNTLWIQCRQQQLSALASLLRTSSWHLLQSNPYATDTDGSIAPSLLACNNAGSKSICIRLGVRRGPEIYLQKQRKKSFQSDLVLADQWRRLRGDFEEMDYSSFEGVCFFHKLELLLASLA